MFVTLGSAKRYSQDSLVVVNMQHNPAGYKLMIRVGYDYQGWQNMQRGCEGRADTNPFLRADIEALTLAIRSFRPGSWSLEIMALFRTTFIAFPLKTTFGSQFLVITDKEDYQKYIKIQPEEHSAAELGLHRVRDLLDSGHV
ncbi:hypothetical protein AGABI2DRAFT_175975 [Agaricus bisporus var. bisporus H97]|uniref:hypothetical protein n=1 Tax=Agaricus bisporus var. bisporus (strain H97 / ATCC MYA-4626 / FGSC 10389) TaxID=936046 RepID=UPI00029F7E19|nr:hypothetical protein AGABI2DRAFT_175975 [Agaricus bisporus var. bisporus H97]EKV51420.1 hypothetical protein AGABI2DRAFT_175975 [Agaricus bisporus var. bisporus H97]